MDVTLTKFVAILVMCGIINYATGIPIENTRNEHVNSRYKRSPPDNLSLFGFGIKTSFSVPNLITSVRGKINNFENLFQTAPDQSQTENIVRQHNPAAQQSQNELKNKKKIISKPDQVPTPHTGNVIKNFKPVLTPTMENIDSNTNIQHVEVNKNDTKSIPEGETIASSTDTTTKIAAKVNENKNLEANIDKKLLHYIFNTDANTIDSTTTDTIETGDYTTGTGDYDTTTLDDDLLRIPAPVVATLLG